MSTLAPVNRLIHRSEIGSDPTLPSAVQGVSRDLLEGVRPDVLALLVEERTSGVVARNFWEGIRPEVLALLNEEAPAVASLTKIPPLEGKVISLELAQRTEAGADSTCRPLVESDPSTAPMTDSRRDPKRALEASAEFPGPNSGSLVHVWLLPRNHESLVAFWSPPEGDGLLPGLAQRWELRTRGNKGGVLVQGIRPPGTTDGYQVITGCQPATPYHVDLGFVDSNDQWHSVGRSAWATTPPDLGDALRRREAIEGLPSRSLVSVDDLDGVWRRMSESTVPNSSSWVSSAPSR